jgi:SPP1 gp7 family putative phage head morphogenesis protein
MAKPLEKFAKDFEPALAETLRKVLVASGREATVALVALLRGKGGLRAAAKPVDIRMQFDATSPHAVAWIQEHAAETVDGITKATRQAIADSVERALTEQFSIDDLIKEISDDIGDADRAEVIARTETMRASNQGLLESWDQATDKGLLTGSELKVWIVTPDDRLCPICEPLDEEKRELDDTFNVDGDEIDGPPAHPRCRCTLGLVSGTTGSEE